MTEALPPIPEELDAMPHPERLADLDPQAATRVLVEYMPTISSRQICAVLQVAQGTAPNSKTVRRWRNEIKAQRNEVQEHDTVAEAAPNLAVSIAAELQRELKSPFPKDLTIARLTQALARAETIASATALQDQGPDWSRLTDTQASALGALYAVAQGTDLDPEGQWWIALFSRVPGPSERPHPSRVALPGGAPEPDILDLAKGA